MTDFDWGRWLNDTKLRDRYLETHSIYRLEASADKLRERYAAFDKVFNEFFDAARENGVIFVCSAGNWGLNWDANGDRLTMVGTGDMLPQNRGGRDSEIIVVGASDNNGTLYPQTCPRGVHINGELVQSDTDPRLAANGNPSLGWIDIWAPGLEVPTCSNQDREVRQASGTSISSALVVSLVPVQLMMILVDLTLISLSRHSPGSWPISLRIPASSRVLRGPSKRTSKRPGA